MATTHHFLINKKKYIHIYKKNTHIMLICTPMAFCIEDYSS